METNNREINPSSEIDSKSILTPENVNRVYDQVLMHNEEYGKRVTLDFRFDYETFNKKRLKAASPTIVQFAKQMLDDFQSDKGADSKMAKFIKDDKEETGFRPWTEKKKDYMRVLALLKARKIGKVITSSTTSKLSPPSERSDFIFKTDWVFYEKVLVDEANEID